MIVRVVVSMLVVVMHVFWSPEVVRHIESLPCEHNNYEIDGSEVRSEIILEAGIF